MNEQLSNDVAAYGNRMFKRGIARGRSEAFDEMRETLDAAYEQGRSEVGGVRIIAFVVCAISGLVTGVTCTLVLQAALS